VICNANKGGWICRGKIMKKIIIFVHGLRGNTQKTWGNFLGFLREDPEVDYEIDAFQYASPQCWEVVLGAWSIDLFSMNKKKPPEW
jgi:hypothetical protein